MTTDPARQPLARRSEDRAHHVVDGGVEVGVRHCHEEILRAASALHSLARRRRLRIDVLGDGRRSDERDAANVRMLQYRVDSVLRSMHHVQHAGGYPRFDHQLRHPRLRQRHLLRRLHDDGVAGSDGVGDEPVGHHEREVERADDAEHADGLTHGLRVDAAGDVLQPEPLHQRGDACSDFDVFDGAPRLAPRILDGFFVLLHDDARQFLEAILHQPIEREEAPRAEHRRRLAPRQERLFRRSDGVAHVGVGGDRHLRDALGRRRILDIEPFAGAGLDPLAVDQISQPAIVRLDLRQHVAPPLHALCERLPHCIRRAPPLGPSVWDPRVRDVRCGRPIQRVAEVHPRQSEHQS